ncbi:MAG: ATP-binding protein [Pseudomonadota bacterium]
MTEIERLQTIGTPADELGEYDCVSALPDAAIDRLLSQTARALSASHVTLVLSCCGRRRRSSDLDRAETSTELSVPVDGADGRSIGSLIAVFEEPDRDSAIMVERLQASAEMIADSLEQRQNVAAAQRMERLLTETIEALADGLVVFDRDDRLVVCNSKFRDLYKVTAPIIRPGARFEDLLLYGVARGQYPEAVGNEDAFIKRRLYEHLELCEAVEQELPGDRWLRIDELETSDGARVGMRVDITDLKRQQRELKSAREEAERAGDAKMRFLANMSHDLRTPLNAIIGFSQSIEAEVFGPVGAPRYCEYASDIRNAGEHLLGLIHEILDWSKIETGALRIDESAFDLLETIKACSRMVSADAERYDIRICEPNIPAGLGLLGDERKVTQILVNLVSNAVKFSHRGGEVRIAAEIGMDHRLSVSVSDNGIGVAEKDIALILQPFQQAQSPLTRKRTGTGLGLSITKELIELHGGELAFRSQLGEGTTVSVRFPSERVIAARTSSAIDAA